MGLTGMWPGYRGDAEQGVLRRRSPYHNSRLSLALSALYGPPGGRRKVQRGSYLANFASLSLSLSLSVGKRLNVVVGLSLNIRKICFLLLVHPGGTQLVT